MNPNEPCVKVNEVLGSGSFGRAFKATTLSTTWFHSDHPIVVSKKLFDPGDNAHAEAKVLEQASHPNLVKYITSYRDPLGHLFLVTEYCKDDTLATMVKVKSTFEMWTVVINNPLLCISSNDKFYRL